MTSQDYRISTIVVLCKDCGNDVGAYPGLHKCPPPPSMPAMPSIPSKYQQSSSSYSSSRPNGRRPSDLDSDSKYSGSSSNSYGGGSRTPTSSSYQDRIGNGSSSRTPTATSFQERMRERDREKQQRERGEREAAARSVREDPRIETPTPTTTTTASSGSGTTIWSRLRAAKDIVNATITGEERWPDSDDSDFEGESHVCRLLREHADKKEEQELAAKIAELDMTPVDGTGSLSRSTGAGRNQYLRDEYSSRKETGASISSSGSGDREDYYGRSLRAKGDHSGPDPNENTWSPSNNTANSYGNSNLNANSSGSRYRSTSDVSRDDALSRLEGKSQGDKLAAQVSHLGSTSPRGRTNSPNGGYRAQDQPATSPNYSNNNNQHHQYSNNSQLSPSSAGGQYSNYSPSSSPSPNSNRRYDTPSPGPSSRQPRHGGQPPVSPVHHNNSGSSYRQQQGAPPSSSRGDPYSNRSRGPDPGQGYGRAEYDRKPTYPPSGNGGSHTNNYGQRQQQQNQQPQYQHGQQQQQYTGYGSNARYF
ncbi:hypothetical protein BGZ76_000266 [Entomortierella beljakovae]|nr:hypothetical protein BGZ76_000266 [Entomortierella beljakovae]